MVKQMRGHPDPDFHRLLENPILRQDYTAYQRRAANAALRRRVAKGARATWVYGFIALGVWRWASNAFLPSLAPPEWLRLYLVLMLGDAAHPVALRTLHGRPARGA